MSAFERLLEQKAVALQYSPEKDTAPVIVASGMGYMAEKITEAARKSGAFPSHVLPHPYEDSRSHTGCQ